MGFLRPKSPVINTVQTPAPTVDDDRVRRAADDEARRAARKRGSGNTDLRQTGGLASQLRQTVGGASSAVG